MAKNKKKEFVAEYVAPKATSTQVEVELNLDNDVVAKLNRIAKNACTDAGVVAAVMLALFVENNLPPPAPAKKK